MAADEVRTWKMRMRDAWLALPFHWVVHLLLLGAVIGTYWLLHELGRGKYLQTTQPVLAAATQSLAITAAGSELKLTFKGSKLEHAEVQQVLASEFLGVGGTPAVVGTVHSYATWVAESNNRLVALATGLVTHAPRDDAVRSWQVPLYAVWGDAGKAPDGWLRPRKLPDRLSTGQLVPNDFLLLIDALSSGDHVVLEPASVASLDVRAEQPDEPRLLVVRRALAEAGNEHKRVLQHVAPTAGVERLEPLPPASASSLRAWARRPFQDAAEQLLGAGRKKGQAVDDAAKLRAQDERKRVRDELDAAPLHTQASILAREANSALRSDLLEVLQAELGEMWFFGRYKWCEIAFWTVFGVLIMGLAELGYASARGRRMRDGTLWQPRETLRVVGRIAYAPFLTIGFLWLAIATPLLEGYEFLATSTFGVLAFAFLVGFVPNTLLDRLQRTLQAMLGREEKPATANPANLPRTSVGTKAIPQNALPSLEDLKARLQDICTAPLR